MVARRRSTWARRRTCRSADVRSHALGKGLAWWSLSPFAAAPTDAPELRDSMGERVSFDIDPDAGAVRSRAIAAHEVDPYRGETAAAVEDVRGWLRDGWRVVCVTEGHGPAQRLAEVFSEAELPARAVEGIDGDPEPGVVLISQGQLDHGFIADGIKFAVLTENDLAGQRSAAERRSQQRMPSRRKKAVDPLELAARRLRRARAARRRPVRRDDAAHRRHRRAEGHPRVHRDRVRAEQARPARRPAVRADRPARPGHPVRRRRAAHAWTRWAAATGPSARAAPARRSGRSPAS